MTSIVVNVLLAVAVGVGLIWAAAVTMILIAAVARATRSRRGRCACGTWRVVDSESWVWCAGVLHEQDRCSTDRETV